MASVSVRMRHRLTSGPDLAGKGERTGEWDRWVRAGDVRGVGEDGADMWGRAVRDGASAQRRSWSGAWV